MISFAIMEIRFETNNEIKQLRLVVTSVTEFTLIYFYLLIYKAILRIITTACRVIIMLVVLYYMMHNTIISD